MEKNRTASQKVILLGFGFASVLLIMFFLLVWLYPIGIERELSRRPMSIWYLVYGLAIALAALSILGISSICALLLARRPTAASFCAAVATFLLQLLYCVVVLNILPAGSGMSFIDIMNAKFLAEWQFLKIIGVVSPVSALLSAVLTWAWMNRSH
ncbi:MAG: hypothetical protein QUT30_19740 [Acidobacteriota bacterium]|jgi:hypothetical protein|nr:hypothetical protein [Acidobacteriota bacterium]